MSTNLVIDVREDESLENALRRLRKKMRKEGLIAQIRESYYYEKPSDRKRRKRREGKYRGKGKNPEILPPESVPRILDYSDLLWEFEHR